MRTAFFLVPFLLLMTGLGSAELDRNVANGSQGNRIHEGMVFIPTGSFLMGDTVHEDEQPLHEVSLDAF